MKKLICLCLSFLLIFSAVSISVSAVDFVVYGDVTADGIIDVHDLLFLRLRVAKLIGNSEINRINSDINADGTINALDISYLRQHLIKKKVIEVANIYPISALSECMNLFGRAQLSDDGESILLSQTASGFEFTANCGGNLEIFLKTNKNGKLNITVNDNFASSYEIDVNSKTTKYVVNMDLPKNEYAFLIQKATEHGVNPRFEITGVCVGGELGTVKPSESDKRIEFYGDSLTSGYGNLTTTATTNAGGWEYQNGCKTYATFTAQNLGADYAIGTASGHGILGGHSDFVSKHSKFFDYTLVDDKTPWNRAAYDADLIVINFGSNDRSRILKQQDGKLLPEFNETEFIADFSAECSKIVEQMHSENPKAKILWVLGMSYVAEDSPVIKSIKQVDEKYDYVDFSYFPARCNGGDWHPTVEDHKYHATNLTNKIKELYPNMFK